MLRRIALRDFVIVRELELETGPGFSVLTGETGAGKSILVDALQLALGARGDAGVVREGAARAEIVAEFAPPPTLAAWPADAGFAEGVEQPVEHVEDTAIAGNVLADQEHVRILGHDLVHALVEGLDVGQFTGGHGRSFRGAESGRCGTGRQAV